MCAMHILTSSENNHFKKIQDGGQNKKNVDNILQIHVTLKNIYNIALI